MINENFAQNEVIELALPINPAYVSAARLTASSIANRMNFDIEEIEDIKTAVSEACTYLIRRNSKRDDGNGKFNINFILHTMSLEINFTCELSEGDSVDDDDKMGIIMIKALMDEVSLHSESLSMIEIKMKKNKNQAIQFE